MKKGKVKILWIGDFVTATGFSRVNHSILKYLPRDVYDVSCLGINYNGDPHQYPYLKIFPASNQGHIYGFNRIKEFTDEKTFGKFDIIFILNDQWIINEYLRAIKDNFKVLPKIVTYMPMDSTLPDEKWFENFNLVSKINVYTQFGMIQYTKYVQI